MCVYIYIYIHIHIMYYVYLLYIYIYVCITVFARLVLLPDWRLREVGFAEFIRPSTLSY